MTRWRLRLYGEVEAPATLTWDEVGNLPKTALTADMHCVTTWSRLDNNWEGVAFKELVALVKPRTDAKYVIAHCDADYTTSLPIDLLADDDVLIAYRHDGAALTPDHGGRFGWWFPSATPGRARSGSRAWNGASTTGPGSGSATATTTPP